MATKPPNAGAIAKPLLQEREIKKPEISGEEIRSRVAEAAYYRALQRGFTPGKELEDWLHAEAQIMTRLGAGLERN